MIDLAKAKSHLRITVDDENDLIDDYIDVARDFIESYLDRKIFATQQEIDDAVAAETYTLEETILDNKKIDQATLQLVGYFYENRELPPTTIDGICRRLISTDKRFGV